MDSSNNSTGDEDSDPYESETSFKDPTVIEIGESSANESNQGLFAADHNGDDEEQPDGDSYLADNDDRELDENNGQLSPQIHHSNKSSGFSGKISDAERKRYESLPFSKMPVINLYTGFTKNARCEQLIADIRKLDIHDFAINQLAPKKTFIETAAVRDFNRIKQFLKDNDIPFFTYTPKISKLQSFVLHGLPKDTDTVHITRDLDRFATNALRFIQIVEYKDYQNKSTRHRKRKQQPFIVQIDRASSKSDLFAIKQVLGYSVRWTPFTRNKIIQCHRCQGLGHSATNCNMPYRCVKCGQTHSFTNCSLPPDTVKGLLRCALCGSNGHPASYRGCRVFLQAEKAQHLAERQQNEKKRHDRKMRRYKRRKERAENRAARASSQVQIDSDFNDDIEITEADVEYVASSIRRLTLVADDRSGV